MKSMKKKAKKLAKKEAKAPDNREAVDENKNIEVDALEKGTTINNQGKIACDVCLEFCPSLTQLKEHRETKHHEVLNYNCKLCDKLFKTEEEYRNHIDKPDHINLSKSVDYQFKHQIGKICDECQLFETQDNTTYSFCEDDDHIDIFDQIWSTRHCGVLNVAECQY